MALKFKWPELKLVSWNIVSHLWISFKFSTSMFIVAVSLMLLDTNVKKFRQLRTSNMGTSLVSSVCGMCSVTRWRNWLNWFWSFHQRVTALLKEFVVPDLMELKRIFSPLISPLIWKLHTKAAIAPIVTPLLHSLVCEEDGVSHHVILLTHWLPGSTLKIAWQPFTP